MLQAAPDSIVFDVYCIQLHQMPSLSMSSLKFSELRMSFAFTESSSSHAHLLFHHFKLLEKVTESQQEHFNAQMESLNFFTAEVRPSKTASCLWLTCDCRSGKPCMMEIKRGKWKNRKYERRERTLREEGKREAKN